MIKVEEVTKQMKFRLAKAELEDLILKEAGVTRGPGVTVNFEYAIGGGYDGYGDSNYGNSGRWEPYTFGGVTVTITEKVKS